MVWLYCSTKQVLGHAPPHLLPPGTPLLENGIITVQAILKPLSLNLGVGAVMLENETFFIVLVTAMTHVFLIYCE